MRDTSESCEQHPFPVRPSVADGHIDGRRAGVAVHALVAELAALPDQPPAPESIASHAARHSRAIAKAAYRGALYQRLLTGASLYFRLFSLGPDWVCAGHELQLPHGGRLDLLWRHHDGDYLIDEIKTKALGTRAEQLALEEQLARYLRIGRLNYTERFAGVRVLILGAPRRSFLAAPDATRTPIAWERTW